MKKFLLAPAVAVVAGSMTLAGNVAFAATEPAPEAPKKTASAAASEDITVDVKDSYTRDELDQEITVTVKGLEDGQYARIALSAKGKVVTEGAELADENGVAKVRVGVYGHIEPEYSITLFVDGDKVDFAGKKTIKVEDPSPNYKLDKINVTDKDLTSKDTAPVLSGYGLEPNAKYYIQVSDPLDSHVERIYFTSDEAGKFSIQIVLPADKAAELIGNKEYALESSLWVMDSDQDYVGDAVRFHVTKAKKEAPKPEKPKPEEEAPKPEKPKPEEEAPKPEKPKPEEEAPKPEKPKPEEEAPKPEKPKPEEEAPKPGEGDKSEEEAAKYALKVSPKEVTPGDFVKKEKGVKLVVTGLKPNEKFTYSVSKQAGNGKVETLFNDVQANKDGVWAYTVYGREAGAGLQGFVGTYKVTVKSEEGVLTDTFTVTNTPGKKDDAKPGDKGDGKGDAKGGDNNSGNSDAKNTGNDSGKSNNAKGNGTSSNTLPRTGMELSGLIAGGVLLTVGAATVLVTRRRTK
ncbi:hypothetical protein [Brevibacterium paucivorans]|uniref:hypothetical protein n=1 Tax=Brevibacterium paucivorans TaxID=170994 RepID=UPI00321B9C19